MTSWIHYMDDANAYFKTITIKQDLSILNLFNGNVSFMYEQEINGKIFFLGIYLEECNTFENTVHTL